MRDTDLNVIGLIVRLWRGYPLYMSSSLVLMVLASLAEGVGVMVLLPVLQLATGGATGAGDELAEVVRDFATYLGISPTLGPLLTLVVIGMFAKAGLVMLAMSVVGVATAEIAANLRSKFVQALMKARWSYFTGQSTGALANTIGSEVMRAAGTFGATGRLISETIKVVLFGVLALMVSWHITLAAVVAGALLFVVMHALVRVVRRASMQQTAAMRSLASRMTEGLVSFKAIKAMGQESWLSPLLEAETKEISRAQQRETISIAAMTSAREPLLVLVLALGLFAAIAYMHAPLAQLLFMAVLFQRTLTGVGAVQNAVQQLMRFEPVWQSINHSIAQAEAAREQHSGTHAPQLDDAIELRDVSFSYDEGPVLTGIDMTIPAGRLTAIIGPSGSGKTTIVDLIVGLHHPDSGRITLDDLALSKVDIETWRHSIGYVPQEVFLFNDSVLANITLDDPQISASHVEAALRGAGAWDFVSALPHGLHTVVGERGGRLSGGQRQRIAIARALVRDPLLLVFDEATAGVDSRTERSIYATLKSLSGKVTILAISHQPALADAADVVYRLQPGKGLIEERSSQYARHASASR